MFLAVAVAGVVTTPLTVRVLDGTSRWGLHPFAELCADLALLFAILVAVAIPVTLVWNWRTGKAMRGAINSHECPRCGYDLAGLPIERGITTCPECALVIPRPPITPF